MDMNNIEVERKSLHTAQNVLFPFIAGFGILANTFVIVVIIIWEKSRMNRTVANLFVINLAIADLLFLITLPLYMPILIDEGWIYGIFMCKFVAVIKYVNFRASICFLTTMTVDRYLAIVHSLASRSYRTRKNGIKVCIFLWLLSFCISIPMLIYANVRNDEGYPPRCEVQFPGHEPMLSLASVYDFLNVSMSGYGEDYPTSDNNQSSDLDELNRFLYSYDYGNSNDFTDEFEIEGLQEPLMCVDKENSKSTANAAWVYANFVFFFVLPVCIIVFSYVGIIKVTATSTLSNKNSSDVQKQVTVMVAVLVSVFLICWLPFQIFELMVLPPGVQLNSLNACLVIKTAFEMLAWSNSAVNPILYSISSKRFLDKAVFSWTYVRHGKNRASTLQRKRSQRTTHTKIHTGSVKGMVVALQSKDKPPTPEDEENTPFQV